MSVVLAWCFEEHYTPQALMVLRRLKDDGLLVPSLWWYELENGLLLGERRGRRKTEESVAFLKLIHALPIHTDDAPQHLISEQIITLGRRHQLTAYDAAYLELAVRTQASLATFDHALRNGATRCGLKIIPANI